MELDRFVRRDVLERDPAVAFALDQSGVLIYVNPAWDSFARNNDGSANVLSERVLGTPWLDHILGSEVRAWYADFFARLLESECSGSTLGVTLDAECNSTTTRRRMVERFEPLCVRRGEVEGVLVISTVVAEEPIPPDWMTREPGEVRFQREDGMVLQCSGCRRCLVAGSAPHVWLFVPDFVSSQPDNVTHGICGICRELYYRPWRRGRPAPGD